MEFFVVTISRSVYHVKDDDGTSHPSATKIACGGKSNVGVGKSLHGGTMIGIGKTLVAFIPEGSGFTSPMSTIERDHNMVNTRWWGGSTSMIVALFSELEDALKCACVKSLEPCDPRWIESTKTVLQKIGDENHTISISHCSGFTLMQ